MTTTFIDFDSQTATVGQLVAQDIRLAETFKRLGIDFCCGGKQTLVSACRKAGLPLHEVVSQLRQTAEGRQTPAHQFADWKPAFLIDYIVNIHHAYLDQNLPFIDELMQKVVYKHGDRYSTLGPLKKAFDALRSELESHMAKEEQVLFPAIKNRVVGEGPSADAGFLGKVVGVMEDEHTAAGLLLAQIHELTDGYTPPADACNSHRLLVAKLAELETDLMQHIHLENNILFPKVLKPESAA